MADNRQKIVVRVTDLASGAEQISGEIVALPGYGFCCTCSTSSLTTPQVSLQAQQAAAQAAATKAKG